MKKTIFILLLGFAVLISSCSKNYAGAIVGTWDAGKASRESRIVVTIRNNGSLTAALTNTDMKPIKGTYEINENSLVIRLPDTILSYKITRLDDRTLVMSSDTARITWNRLK
jgi:hypothetical protein